MNYVELKTALSILGISERASLSQIKNKHRDMVKQHHPDHTQNTAPEEIRKINAAYEVLTLYCTNYRYSFTEAEFLEQVPEERLRRQFEWDPVWSGKAEEKD